MAEKRKHSKNKIILVITMIGVLWLLPTIILLISWIRTYKLPLIIPEYCFTIGIIRKDIKSTKLDYFRSDIVLIEFNFKRSSLVLIRELRRFGSVSHDNVTEFAVEEIPIKFLKILNSQELKKMANKDLDKFTPIFVTTFIIVSALVKDINQNGVPDIILRVLGEKDEYGDEYVCAYEVYDNKIKFLWSYYLDKSVLSLIPLWSLDRICFRADGTVEVVILEPLKGAFVIQFDSSKKTYIKLRAPISKFFTLWFMAVESLFSVSKWFFGIAR